MEEKIKKTRGRPSGKYSPLDSHSVVSVLHVKIVHISAFTSGANWEHLAPVLCLKYIGILDEVALSEKGRVKTS